MRMRDFTTNMRAIDRFPPQPMREWRCFKIDLAFTAQDRRDESGVQLWLEGSSKRESVGVFRYHFFFPRFIDVYASARVRRLHALQYAVRGTAAMNPSNSPSPFDAEFEEIQEGVADERSDLTIWKRARRSSAPGVVVSGNGALCWVLGRQRPGTYRKY